MGASAQFRPSPLGPVFYFGYEELERKSRPGARPTAPSPPTGATPLQARSQRRALQLELTYDLARDHGSVAPGSGLMGTVRGIITAFNDLREMTSTTSASAPAISKRLIADRHRTFAAQDPPAIV